MKSNRKQYSGGATEFKTMQQASAFAREQGLSHRATLCPSIRQPRGRWIRLRRACSGKDVRPDQRSARISVTSAAPILR